MTQLSRYSGRIFGDWALKMEPWLEYRTCQKKAALSDSKMTMKNIISNIFTFTQFWVSLDQITSNKTILEKETHITVQIQSTHLKAFYTWYYRKLLFQRCQVCSLYYPNHSTQNNRWFILIHPKHVHYPCPTWVIIDEMSLPESRVFSMHQRIVNRPESMEQKRIFIPAGDRFHFVVWLISNTMVNKFDICLWAKNRV